MPIKRLLFISMFLIFNTGCFYDETGEMIYILSKTMGSNGKLSVPDQKFQAIMSQTVFRANRSTLNILNIKNESAELQLSRVSLGLDLEVEAGIKNIAEVAGESTIELRFEHLPNP